MSALILARSYCPFYRLHHWNFVILLVIAKVYQLGQIGLEVLLVDDRVIAFAIVKTTQPGSNYSWRANFGMYKLIASNIRRVQCHLRLSR
jgi:hypothetical protein